MAGGFSLGLGSISVGAGGSLGGSGGLFPVQIGQFTAWGFSVPEKLNLGGAQRLGVHQLPNGIRILDSMGPDDDDITWSGQFILRNPGDPDPVASAQYLDYLRKQGAPVTLSYESFSYLVVIEHFKAEFEYVTVVPFSLVCKIVEDQSSPGAAGNAGAGNVDTLVTGDFQNSLAVLPALGMSVPTGLPGPFASTIGAVAAASTAISFLGSGVGSVGSNAVTGDLPGATINPATAVNPSGLPIPMFNTLAEANTWLASRTGYSADWVAASVRDENSTPPATGVEPDGLTQIPNVATQTQALTYLTENPPGWSVDHPTGS